MEPNLPREGLVAFVKRDCPTCEMTAAVLGELARPDLEERGVPAVGVATTEFVAGAAAQAKSLGTDPALVFIPHPVQDRTDDELRQFADDHFDAIPALLVKSG